MRVLNASSTQSRPRQPMGGSLNQLNLEGGITIKKPAIAAARGMAFLAVANIFAAADRDQHWAIERTQEANQKLRQVQAADAVERRVLLVAHMCVPGQVVDEMNSMKPKPDWNMQQTDSAVSMGATAMIKEVLRQMVEEYRLMMKALRHAEAAKRQVPSRLQGPDERRCLETTDLEMSCVDDLRTVRQPLFDLHDREQPEPEDRYSINRATASST